MGFTYENQGTHTYLVYQLAPEAEMDTMGLGMITNNKISGLAPVIFVQMDDRKYLKYDVSSRVSVKQFFTGIVNKKRLTGVFRGIVNAVLSAEEYMINQDNIVLDLDYIYTDVSTCETNLICIPVMGEEKKVDMGMLFKNIVFSTQFDQTENCDYVARLISYFNSASTFQLEDFKKVLDEISNAGLSASSGSKAASAPKAQTLQPQQQPVNGVPASQAQTFQSQQASGISAPQAVAMQPQPVLVPQNPMQQNVVQNNPVLPNQAQIHSQPFTQTAVGSQSSGKPPKKQRKQKQQTAPQAQMPIPSPQGGSSQPGNEKQVGLMTLLTHYSKENKALYKEQKAQKKENEKRRKMASQSACTGSNMGFEIPGQPPRQQSAQPQQSMQNRQQAVQQEQIQQTVQREQIQQAVHQMQAQQMVQQAQIQYGSGQAINPQVQPMQQVCSQGMPPKPQMPANFGETTVLNVGNNIGETTVLGVSASQTEMKPMLYRQKTNERIVLDKPVFRIGKERSYVDYFIGDNSAISRSHASIVRRNNEYYVVDTNSTNHTYVNGVMIQSNVETKISHGTKIQLANEEFEFRMY